MSQNYNLKEMYTSMVYVYRVVPSLAAFIESTSFVHLQGHASVWMVPRQSWPSVGALTGAPTKFRGNKREIWKLKMLI